MIDRPLPTLRTIVGTAGHIDHGKTRLIEALTGIDCDRWIEEKERGITIDLGFAHLRDNDLQVGFIDVPGHERFVHNALAGLGGIRVVLLVVAADEGVKPQTREHLEICNLLQIPGCVVALTKTDLVTEDIVDLARLEVEELLSSSNWRDTTIVPVSSKTGEGVEELRCVILDLARQWAGPANPNLPTRIPVDRAFHLKGLGAIVTGTLVSGTVAPGDTLGLLPGQQQTRIRSIQVHGEARQRAVSGERTALQLSGVTLDDLHRGVQLVSPDRFAPTVSILARFRLSSVATKPLKGSAPIRLHLYTSEVLGRARPLDGVIQPGDEGIVEIRLGQPVVAVRGDRFVIRRPSPATTLGGGEVLDSLWHRHRGPELRHALGSLTGSEHDAVRFWVDEAREAGIAANALARRLGTEPQEVDAVLRDLTADQRVVRVVAGSETRWIVPAAFARIKERAARILSAYFKRQRLAVGMPKAEAVDRILPGRSAELASTYLDWLQRQQVLEIDGDVINLPGRSAALTGDESRLAKEVLVQYEAAGLQPPPPPDVCSRLAAKPQIFDGIVKLLVDQGRLVRLPGGLLISRLALDNVTQSLRSEFEPELSVGDFKDRFQLTRKWAIPILEYLDSSGVTRRVGDKRQIVGRV